jgi:putative ATPase
LTLCWRSFQGYNVLMTAKQATTDTSISSQQPLADALRPTNFAEVAGQEQLLADDAPLGRMIASGKLASLVFWGPPGSGKTTLARLLAGIGELEFVQISAIFSGVADLKKIFSAARERREQGLGTLLFVDEIHRFNRAQQDGFLPYVEDGSIILVGATTENPSFELNSALLSRLQVLVLERLDLAALEQIMTRAEAYMQCRLPLDDDARQRLLTLADGDGRYLLNSCELLFNLQPAAENDADKLLDSAAMLRLLQRRAPVYDKDREAHYNLISALHKSLRGSDCDAALYWLARMLSGGEDPLYICRRLIRFASEDIGLADPQALPQALAAREAFHVLGSPEGELAIVQAVIYLATAPKSNAAYQAQKQAKRAADKTGSLPPPAHILNAPTGLMKDLGYGKDYAYDHDTAAGFSGQNYFPEGLPRAQYYQPVKRGFERDIHKRLQYWKRLREQA